MINPTAALFVIKDGWTISAAAKAYGITRDTLAKRVQRLKERVKRFTLKPRVVLYLFPSASAFERYFAMIKSAKRSIDVRMYCITHDGLVDYLIDFASREATAVRVLVDLKESRHSYSRVKKLILAGVEVRRLPTTTMHAKTVVLDSSTLLTGSFNWTARAAERSVEMAIPLIDMPNAVRQVRRAMNATWAVAIQTRRQHVVPGALTDEPDDIHEEANLAQVLTDFEVMFPGVFEGLADD